MAKNTTIICTITPKRVDETHAYFSVFLSPRLPQNGILKDYFEIARWYDFIEFFKSHANLKASFCCISYNQGTREYRTVVKDKDYLDIEFDGSILESLKKAQPTGATRGDCMDDLPKSYPIIDDTKELWTCLFNDNTPVRGWEFDEGALKEKSLRVYNSKTHGAGTTFTQEQCLPEAPPIQIIPEVSHATAEEDISENRMEEDEIILRNKENQEFHKRMSILATYPHLLRATGWILDFKIALGPDGYCKEDNKCDNEGPALCKNNLIKITGIDNLPKNLETDKWKNFIDEIDFKTPWTYFHFNKGSKQFSIKYSEMLSQNYFIVENGYIHAAGPMVNGKPFYEIVSEQFNRAKSLKKMANRLPDNPEVTTRNYAALSDLLNPAPAIADDNGTSEGLTLRLKNLLAPNDPPGQVTIDEQNNKPIKINTYDNASSNIDDYVIFGHHLDSGYVIEVSNLGKNNFKSLSERIATYTVDRSKKTSSDKRETILKDYKDEGWISEVAVAGKSGKLYINEEICRWNNWSLVCPQIGNHVQDEKIKEGFWEYNDLELIDNRPPVGSLLPLRFGRGYTFRIRVVDICGNTVKMKTEGSHPELDINTKKPYRRIERVGPVQFYFCDRAYHKAIKFDSENPREHISEVYCIKDRYLGESADVMIIRSSGEMMDTKIIDTRTTRYTRATSERSISPPRISVHFAEIHGEFDSLLHNKHLRREIYTRAAYEAPKNYKIEHFQMGDKIPFITDPVYSKVRMTMKILNRLEDGELVWEPECYGDGADLGTASATLEFEPNYLDQTFKRIVLECKDKYLNSIHRHPTTHPEYDAHTVNVNLRPGTIGEVSITVSVDHLKDAYKDIFCDTTNALKTIKKIFAIHAVKRPILYCPDLRKLKLQVLDRLPLTKVVNPHAYPGIDISTRGDRKYEGDLNVDVLFKVPDESVVFPFSSSSEIVLTMKYTDFVINLNSEKGYDPVEIIKVKTFKNLREANFEIARNEPVQSRIVTPPPPLSPLKYGGERVKSFMESPLLGQDRWLSHSFNDTKFREVTYKLEGHSRFRQFFPEKEDAEHFIYRRELEQKQIVKNSKKLKAPVVHSIVPLLHWNLEKGSPSRLTRTNQNFRIYLEGSWYESGAEEKLAVMFIPDALTIGEDLEGFVSSIGRDPAFESKPSVGLKKTFFTQSVFTQVDAPLLNFDPRKESDIDTRPGVKVTAALFDVHFDSTKKLFFADLEIKANQTDDMYMPFLKLALCKYQEHSITLKDRYDFRFSKVAMAPQVQIFPDRSIIWNTKDGALTVSGKSKNIPANQFYVRTVRRNKDSVTPLILNFVAQSTEQNVRPVDLINEAMVTIVPDGEDAIYLEEYETYHALNKDGEEFTTNESDPVNDIRKRLVLTCNLLEMI
ncbi:hypothetical protein [Ohtaekwangia koreensis]|uniref:Uncharacterized protein n=1 Tax=Ohtaekwangia koreensis TaxID=688867 RepID=A0A1T5J3V0_9BACT|nr:hypothetical protein [Ohtaekwangia koreensis]SKC45878.1 hypothetical protein SAMN05660236_0714 [Ohtaekwangia koreensis]